MKAECDSCELSVEEFCAASKKPCGHHCNHSWSHEHCCWCGKTWGDEFYEEHNVDRDRFDPERS